MQLKIHKSYRDVVAFCDSELLGKYFEEGKLQLNMKESFYKGDELTNEQAQEQMEDLAKEDVTFNIVGKKATEIALKAKIIEKEGIKTVSGIPFALVLM